MILRENCELSGLKAVFERVKSNIRIGGKMSSVKNAISLGIDDKSGILLFKDKAGDGVLLVGDVVVLVFHWMV
jgi:hypothetical protein